MLYQPIVECCTNGAWNSVSVSAHYAGSTSAHNKQHMLAGEGSGYHSEVQRVKVGEETIEHREEGHWETVVVGGHWEKAF